MTRRLAVLGTGFGGAHLRWLADCPGARVEALVYGSDRPRAEDLAREHGVPRVAADLDEVVGHVDTVVLVTPPATHLGLGTRALDAGKAVVCDKPLALDGRQARRLAERAASRGLPGLVFFQWRLHEGFRLLRDTVRDDALGALHQVRLTFDHDFLAGGSTRWSWRHDPEAAGAGALGDQGVHLVDLARWLTGEELRVTAASARVAFPTRRLEPSAAAASRDEPTVEARTEDVATALLTTATGVLVTLSVSRVATGRRRVGAVVAGTDGVALLEVEPDTGSYAFDGPGGARPWGGCSRWNPYDHLLAALDGSASEAATFAEGVAAQELVDDIVQAALAPASAP